MVEKKNDLEQKLLNNIVDEASILFSSILSTPINEKKLLAKFPI